MWLTAVLLGPALLADVQRSFERGMRWCSFITSARGRAAPASTDIVPDITELPSYGSAVSHEHTPHGHGLASIRPDCRAAADAGCSCSKQSLWSRLRAMSDTSIATYGPLGVNSSRARGSLVPSQQSWPSPDTCKRSSLPLQQALSLGAAVGPGTGSSLSTARQCAGAKAAWPPAQACNVPSQALLARLRHAVSSNELPVRSISTLDSAGSALAAVAPGVEERRVLSSTGIAEAVATVPHTSEAHSGTDMDGNAQRD